MIILDTNAISELMKPKPEPRVVSYLRNFSPFSVFLTTITEAEMWYGVCQAPEGKKTRALEASVRQTLDHDFAGRILTFDSPAARRYGEILVRMNKLGADPDEADVQIAAIGACHGFAIVTRNVKHFRDSGVPFINPWPD